jgi:hypothetical protein
MPSSAVINAWKVSRAAEKEAVIERADDTMDPRIIA